MHFLIICKGCFTFNGRITNTLHLLALRLFPNSNRICIILRYTTLKTIKHSHVHLTCVFNTFVCVLLSLELCVLKRHIRNSNSRTIVMPNEACLWCGYSKWNGLCMWSESDQKAHHLKVRAKSDTIRSCWHLFRHFPA